MKFAVHAKRTQIQLERLGFHAPLIRLHIDHQGGKVRLAGHRAQAGEFRAGDIQRAGHPGWVQRPLGERVGKALKQTGVGLIVAVDRTAAQMVQLFVQIHDAFLIGAA